MSLEKLQERLEKKEAYLITRNNMFLGQDILEEENALKNLTGFSGSNGNLLVAKDKAYLIVDGRYELQAQNEVDLQKVEVVCVPRFESAFFRINDLLKEKHKIYYNTWCHSIKEVERFTTFNLPKMQFIADTKNLFGNIIVEKESLVFEHALEFSGISSAEKIKQVTGFMKVYNLDAYITSAADSVSWLLNIRSNLLEHSPVVRAFALVDKDGNTTVFSNHEINLKNIKLLPLSMIEKEIAKYKKKKVGFCFYQTPEQIRLLAEKYKLNFASYIDPGQVKKAEKNPIELLNVKKSHIRDGVAVCRFLHWFSKNYDNKTELDVVKKLYDFRKSGENFFSDSFATIAGFGANGAIVHYHPQDNTNKRIKENGLLLLDSGAQYLDGTTDITRTIAIGEPTQEMIDNFTYVLKAHITLSSAIFPKKSTNGMKLDILSRSQMWKQGLDYGHGTGHGVGYFLNVHEGPNSISANGTHYALAENMLTSIEPGYYKENEYGIRIENVYLIKSHNENFLEFEALTLAPIDKQLLNLNLLNKDEINWLNDYHKKVYSSLEKHLNKEEKEWLKSACSGI